MTETPDQKMPRGQVASVALSADNGAHIDTIGVIVIGSLFLIVLLAYMRAQGRNRKLYERLVRLENQSADRTA